jgi:hypothetical protein
MCVALVKFINFPLNENEIFFMKCNEISIFLLCHQMKPKIILRLIWKPNLKYLSYDLLDININFF